MSEHISYISLQRNDRTNIIIQYFNTLDIGTYVSHKEYGNYDVDIDYLDKIDGQSYLWFVDKDYLRDFYNSTLNIKNKSEAVDQNSWVHKFNKILSK
jgi:hypothetical protein